MNTIMIALSTVQTLERSHINFLGVDNFFYLETVVNVIGEEMQTYGYNYRKPVLL